MIGNKVLTGDHLRVLKASYPEWFGSQAIFSTQQFIFAVHLMV